MPPRLSRKPEGTDGQVQSSFDLRFRIINKIGMIDTLSAGIATRLLETLDLPAALFGLLHHFAEHPDRAQTVSHLAKTMQVPQPGVTKRVQKLLGRGLLREAPSPTDARKKMLFITPEGQALHARAIRLLVPAAREIFAAWDEAELNQLIGQLDRIRASLDATS
jgi:DNA-binding MarR family transcriptional regulator